MANLVTFGCSHTKGDGLYNQAGTYSAILSRKLNIPCHNNAVSGACNKETVRRIQDYEFQSADVVVVQWTYIKRTTVFENINTRYPIRSWVYAGESYFSNNAAVMALNHAYYEYFDIDYDQLFNNKVYFDLVDLYLKTKVKQVVHVVVDIILYDYLRDKTGATIIPWQWDFDTETNDGKHPSESQHKQISQQILSRLDK